MVWREVHEFSADAVLMLLAEEAGAGDNSIRSYDEFRAAPGRIEVDIPFLDLAAATAELQTEIEAAVDRVVRSGWYIGGPEVTCFRGDDMQTIAAQVIASASATGSTLFT